MLKTMPTVGEHLDVVQSVSRPTIHTSNLDAPPALCVACYEDAHGLALGLGLRSEQRTHRYKLSFRYLTHDVVHRSSSHCLSSIPHT